MMLLQQGKLHTMAFCTAGAEPCVGSCQTPAPAQQSLLKTTVCSYPQLRESTQPLAPRMATLLLRLYALAVVPITFWITVFMMRAPVALA